MKANNIEFNAKNKKVNITIRGAKKASPLGFQDIEIETFVREQFFAIMGLRYILRCNIKDYVLDLLNLEGNYTIVHFEIEGFDFNPHPISLHINKDIILPILEIVVNPDRGKKIEVYNVYVDKISYQATHKAFTPFYNLEF